MGWPWSQECLALHCVGFSQGDELWLWRALLSCRAEQAPLLQWTCPSHGLVLRPRGPDVSPQSGVTSLRDGQRLVTGLGRWLVSLLWQGLQRACSWARSRGRNRNSFWGHQSCSSGIQPRRVASKSEHVPLKEAGSAECGMIGQFILGTEPTCSAIISKDLIPFSVLDLSAVQTQSG